MVLDQAVPQKAMVPDCEPGYGPVNPEFWTQRLATIQAMQPPFAEAAQGTAPLLDTMDWTWSAAVVTQMKHWGDGRGGDERGGDGQSSVHWPAWGAIAAYLARLNREDTFELGVQLQGAWLPCRVQLLPKYDSAEWMNVFCTELGQLRQHYVEPVTTDSVEAESSTKEVSDEEQNAQKTASEMARNLPIQLQASDATVNADTVALAFRLLPDGRGCQIRYDAVRFEKDAIAQLRDQLNVFLEGMVTNPEQPLSEQPLLTTADQQLLDRWNQTAADYAYDTCVHHLFEAQAEQTPEAIAVTYRDRAFTYRELNRRANQLAHHLRTLGVLPDGFVGLCVERSLDMVVGLLGILKAGAAYLPLDPTYPPERLALMIEDAQPPVVLTQAAVREQVPSTDAHALTQCLCLDADWETVAQQSTDNPEPMAHPHNLAYIIYTSGSTGRPKGVMIEHRSLANFAQASLVDYGIGGGGIGCNGGVRDRVLQFASISFDAAAEEIYPCLISGGELVLRSPEMMSSVAQFLQQCRDYGLTVLDLPTAYWHLMVAELKADPTLTLPESIRIVIIGGEAVNPQRIAQWQQILWRTGSEAQLINTYGPTEATVVATAYQLPLPTAEPDPEVIPTVTIGQALRNVTTYVLDRNQQPVPVGIPGELCIGGAGIARGYLGREDLTAERFLTDPFADPSVDRSSPPAPRLYRTGDLVRYLPNGEIDFLGRIDNQVKIRGFRIELGEIEALLTQQETVQDAAVIVREDKPGQKQLVAYVVPRPQQTNDQQTFAISPLRQALADKLPEYMVPSAFVTLAALPMTPNEKVDRRSLPLPVPEDFQTSAQTFVAPAPGTEQRLATLWQDVLGLETVGATDNFFELGGTSLLAVKLFMQIEKAFGRSLQLSALLQAPTVQALAAILEGDTATTEATTLVPLQPKGSKAPVFFINSISYAQLFVPHLGQDRPFYCLNLFGATELFTEDLDALTLDKMAEKFVADLLTVQPEGPYYIGSYCGDTKLAIAMGHRLQALGKTVALQAFIDPMWDEPSGLSFHWGNLQRFGIDYAIEKVKNRIRVAQERAVYRSRSTVGKFREADGGRRLQKDLALYAKYQQLCDSYWPQSYSGDVSVICCEELLDSATPRLSGTLQTPPSQRQVPGYHHTIFQEPQLAALVSQFQQAMDAAEATHAKPSVAAMSS